MSEEEKKIDVSRYTDTTELIFDVEFITPTFLGGADGNAEIRTAPFKNGIRYWWRILYGASYLAVGKLKETEDDIFGSTEKKSTIDIVIKNINKNNFTESTGFPNGRKVEVTHQGRSMKINILDYLAYGKFQYVKGKGNVYTNTYIKSGSKINITFSISNTEHVDEIKDSIKMFIMYGGIGSRSRNGFGSMKADKRLSNIPFSKKVCKSKKLEEFPIISSKTRFFKTKMFPKWEDALSEVGEIYKNARNSLEESHSYEKRGYVARPIEVKFERIPNSISKGRMPKPFYLGVNKCENGFYGYIICLPVEFYEKNNQQEYLKVYEQMIKSFSQELKDETEMFLEQLTGAAK